MKYNNSITLARSTCDAAVMSTFSIYKLCEMKVVSWNETQQVDKEREREKEIIEIAGKNFFMGYRITQFFT